MNNIQNKPHITYLLGAGASCDTLPLVSNLAQRISRIHNWLKSNRGLITLKINAMSNSTRSIKSLLLKDLEFLEENANTKRHFSIDTFAKKLFLWNHNNAPTALRTFLKVS